MEPITRVCKKCGERRLLEEFTNDKLAKHGRKYTCKICMSKYQSIYLKKNKDKLNANHKQYRENNKEKLKKEHKEYRLNNTEQVAEYYRIYILSDNYIVHRLRNQTKLPVDLIRSNPELIELKRITIKCRRELKNKNYEEEKRIALCNC